MRAVTLARVSTPDQAEHGYSLEDQERIFARHVQAKGYTLIEAVQDAGFSGQLSHRPGLKRVMELVNAKVVDVVLIVKMDRLGREQRLILNTIHEIRSRGVRVEFVEHVSGDTKEERLQLGVLASVAEFQWETIRQLTMDGRYNKARAGAYPAHIKVYGYRQITTAEAETLPEYQGMGGRLVVVESEAEIVREVFRRYVAGEAVQPLCGDLMARGVPGPRDARVWSCTGLTRILSRPTYVGKLYYGQMTGRKVDELTSSGRQRTKRERRPKSEWIEIPCPAIVDEATWHAAQKRLQINKDAFRGRPSLTWLLRGAVFCGHCTNQDGSPRRMGGVRVSNNKRNPSYSYREYSCSSEGRALAKIEGWCKTAFSAKKMEELAKAMLEEVLQPGRLGELAYQQAEEEQRSLGELPALRVKWEQQLARMDEEERNLIRLARQGAQSAMLAEEMKDIQRQRLEVQERLATVEQRLLALQSPAAARRRGEELSAAIRRRLAAVTADEEPALLQEIYAALFRITVRKGEEPVFEVRAGDAVLPWG